MSGSELVAVAARVAVVAAESLAVVVGSVVVVVGSWVAVQIVVVGPAGVPVDRVWRGLLSGVGRFVETT